MEKNEIFKKVIYQTCKDIFKNRLYKKEDLQHAMGMVYDFYFKNDLSKLKMLSNGNLKLSKNIMIFNLPSTITCACNCQNCYTKKAERLYKNTRIQRMRNYIIMLLCQYDNDFKKIIMDYINMQLSQHAMIYNNNAIVRIHESGDMFNDKYLKFWLNIIKKNKNIKFYTYTKKLNNDIIDNINKNYKNFNIVKSIIELNNKKYFNFGNDEHIKNIALELKKAKKPCYICSYGSENALKCGIECKKCLSCPHVLFHVH